MTELPHLYEKLSWAAAPDDRQAAIAQLLAQPDALDLGSLIQPFGRKDMWDGAAAVLSGLDPARLQPHLPKLLEWLQDMNWPGASTVFQLLAESDPEIVSPPLNAALALARMDDDEDWLTNLASLVQEQNDRS